jgi:hypothetical protein
VETKALRNRFPNTPFGTQTDHDIFMAAGLMEEARAVAQVWLQNPGLNIRADGVTAMTEIISQSERGKADAGPFCEGHFEQVERELLENGQELGMLYISGLQPPAQRLSLRSLRVRFEAMMGARDQVAGQEAPVVRTAIRTAPGVFTEPAWYCLIGHNSESRLATSISSGANSPRRFRVILTVGPAMLNVPIGGLSARVPGMTTATPAIPGSASS